MKRYYICRRLGDGYIDPFRLELKVYKEANHPTEPKHIRQLLSHRFPWVLMCYDLSDTAHADVMANVPNIFSFPSSALSTPVNQIPEVKRIAIQNKLTTIGFEFSWANGTTTIREILEYIAHSMELADWCNVFIANNNFDIHKTISTVNVAGRNKLSLHLDNIGVETGWITGSTTIKEIAQRMRTETGRLFRDND